MNMKEVDETVREIHKNHATWDGVCILKAEECIKEWYNAVNPECPKCGATSGDDWSQCDKKCPMPGSPWYDLT